MAAALKFLFAFLLVIFMCEQGGAETCDLSSISVEITKTGRVVEGDTEFKVEIGNNCKCAQSNLIIGCLGFSTVEPVEPAIFKQVSDEDCLINSGKPIVQGQPVSFTFAWKTPTDLIPKQSQIKC